MGLPEIPKIKKVPKQDVIIRLLLQSVAMEELSLAALVNAEAEKVQEMAKKGIDGPISADEAVKINESVKEVIKAAGEKEDKLLRKLTTLLAMKDKEEKPPSHC